MSTQFSCQNERRRERVRELTPPTLNGIDYLEVTTADQRTLTVRFLHPLPETGALNSVPAPPAPELTPDNVVIEGGARIQDIRVEEVHTNGRSLRVVVNQAGDFSRYTLRLIASAESAAPPAQFDPQLSAVSFSFKAGCPSEFDCAASTACPPSVPPSAELDYLAKDYGTFRRLMFDRLSVVSPGWRDRNPADVQVMLVELLAYVGDHLSYFQDSVATEAYLGTARRRVSVRRHVRLLDYHLHEGCNARVWVHLAVDVASLNVAAGKQFLTRTDQRNGPTLMSERLADALAAGAVVFESLQATTVRAAQNAIRFYTWSDSECCLPAGATRATVRDDDAAGPLTLAPGDVLIFEETRSPTTGLEADADPTKRHPVRLVRADPGLDPLDNTPVVELEWFAEDALPFPLCLSARVSQPGGAQQVLETSVARGNLILADHGRTLIPDAGDAGLTPEVVPERGRFRPRLTERDVTFRVDEDDATIRARPAARTLTQDPDAALPVVRLSDGTDAWTPRRELLASDRFDTEFVTEMENDGRAILRFGDDVLGRSPATGTRFEARYRIGNGQAGNLGAEALSVIVDNGAGIRAVRNPLPAVGGTDPENLAEARQFAPQAFRTQERAVTEADYAAVALRHPEVQQAVANFRWTGSWHTVFVTVDRRGGFAVDAGFEEEMRRHFEKYRLAGYDLEINSPILVPLELKLHVCVAAGYFAANVEAALLTAFSRFDQPDGSRGFFHPDNFTFGRRLYASEIIARAAAVEGVESVVLEAFQRFGKSPNHELETGFIQPAILEILQLDNDPSFPERGRLEFVMGGGL